ncbi:hypothetical protein CEUSTIGMA_g1973.t1 [Chlamydomonas eustigma]|uniref:Uncharacterized protein n=1 Tax=Chlamydomonas eustigma TaxID=1157962 RepID=A0A250WUL9_9CHLO|nr:hypothetical protein CEUSTIGMA_g1973.t1 [Chlamydomonas eustigma]|eukprot:GAX74524.1 hypothetical protein CEUSTIGMA_g1973.t1 [Chlamydomonas eustigma]
MLTALFLKRTKSEVACLSFTFEVHQPQRLFYICDILVGVIVVIDLYRNSQSYISAKNILSMQTQGEDMEMTGVVSSENTTDWTLVDKLELGEKCGDLLEMAPQMTPVPTTCQEALLDNTNGGSASPKSEKAADNVLSQDITDSSSELTYQHPSLLPGVMKDNPGSSCAQEYAPATPADDSAHEAIFQETSALAAVLAVTEQKIQQQGTAALAAVSSWLTSLGEILGNAAEEAQAEWVELRRLVGLAMEQAKIQVEDTRIRVGKVLNNMPPSWTLVSLGAVTALAVVAVGALWMANRKLTQQVRVRDKELASLVVRILNLQETLRRPGSITSGPLMCHTAMVMPPAAPFCAYTVNGWA